MPVVARDAHTSIETETGAVAAGAHGFAIGFAQQAAPDDEVRPERRPKSLHGLRSEAHPLKNESPTPDAGDRQEEHGP
ncbi:MAG: hypothetical protein RKP46_11630 [Candidatus Accumulibacter sp.]|uniref:hypothetical protein n=1 Tax=Accumulibacter sp. TaxID=2053492 RepID=UPI002878FAF3|nr:hypothetical protein [Accumulibacter sp.]MDS4014983.1 hypothetical protein [Accumulibacter sp.]